MLLLIGMVIGLILVLAVNSHVENSNLVAPAMLLMALNIEVSGLLIGVLASFAIVSNCKKHLRLNKMTNEQSNKDLNKVFNNRLAYYLMGILSSFTAIAIVGNVPMLITLTITLSLIIGIIGNYFINQKENKENIIRTVIAVGLIFLCSVATVKNINSLNVFILFFGFITVPNYIFPYATYSEKNVNDGAVRGFAFSLSTSSALAEGVILGQALAIQSERDAIGTLINNYLPENLRIAALVIVVAVIWIYYESKECLEYIKNAPSVLTQNDKQNNKFAFINIVIGTAIAAVYFNIFIFSFIVVSGIACAYLIKNNDTLREMCIPNLLLAGLFFGV